MIRRPFRTTGSALVSTMLVIAVLTIIVVAFLQSMTVEQKTARSYLNRYRAELAAEAAAASAENKLRILFTNYPDSCTAWAKLPSTQGTVFYYRTLSGSDQGALPKDTAIDIKALMLISGATEVKAGRTDTEFTEANVFPALDAADSPGFTSENSIDLNRDKWIGGPRDHENQSILAKWVNLPEDSSKPLDNSIDPATGRAKNGIVARYAYWMEDESFRVNINKSGDKPRGTSTEGTNPSDIDLQAVMEATGIDDFATALVARRDAMPDKRFLTASEASYGKTSGPSSDTYEKLKFYLTADSSALNFSRGGVKRLDLNKVVTNSPSPSDIRDEMDRIIAAIGNPYAVPADPNRLSLSDFGQRFYYPINSANNGYPVPAGNSDIYLQKLAANIRDYIDKDSQPTIVQNEEGFPIRPQSKATASDMIGFDPGGNSTGPSDTAAVGKESVPALDEYAYRAKLNSMTPPKKSAGITSAQYDVEESHYFEFINPTNQDISIESLKGSLDNASPFLLISNQLGYGSAGGDDIPAGRTIEIPLDQFVDGNGNPLTKFPAGKAVVLTTDPNPEETNLPYSSNGANTFFRPNSSAQEAIKDKRHFKGTTRDATSGSPTMFRVLAKFGTGAGRAGSGGSDYDTHVLIGNSDGVIESFTALSLPYANQLSIKYDDNATSPPVPGTKWFQGGSLKGNVGGDVKVASGDPRSLNEQLSIRRYVSGVTNNITRFLSSGVEAGGRGTSTFGALANSFINTRLWPDFAAQTANEIDVGYARIANSELDGIGRLGDIYDPNRSPSEPEYARGGGKTLRIGQSDRYVNQGNVSGVPYPGIFGIWDGNENSVSRNRVAWRLTDFFSIDDALTTPGVININGVSRDGGVSLKAAIYRLVFSTDDPALTGKSLNMDALITAIAQRFPSGIDGGDNEGAPTADDPFWERGEISEVPYNSKTGSPTPVPPLFNTGNKLASVPMETTQDRSREELVRRCLDLFTTKGNVFRVYCVGQAIRPNRDGTLRVLAQQKLKLTFAIEPEFDNPLPSDTSFDGVAELDGNGNSPTKRFRQPDRFKIRILSVNTY
ncbi:MAG TPA: pilus assembly PilX N-terminal domain-containing protein [Chthoniobacterales bacterium]